MFLTRGELRALRLGRSDFLESFAAPAGMLLVAGQLRLSRRKMDES